MTIFALAIERLLVPRSIDAACNVIPRAIQPFRSAVGGVDRPFAGPGDWLELSPDRCGRTGGFAAVAVEEFIATVLFDPPSGGPRSAVILSPTGCDDPVVVEQVAACQTELATSGAVTCQPLRTTGPVLDVDKPSARPNDLRFRFPDTDSLLEAPGDALTITGPAAVVVTRRGAPVPCGTIAKAGCAGVAETGATLACVDRLLADGTCAAVPHPEFSRFTALPPPNDFAALCTDPTPPCTGLAQGRVRLTVDGSGNLLVPMDWSGVLVRRDEVPVPRLLETDAVIPAFQELLRTLRVPGLSFLDSLSPEGRRLPPLFEPQSDVTLPSALVLFGSADAPYTVLRLHRRGVRGVCSTTASRDCAADYECPAGETCARYLECAGGPHAGEPCTGGATGAAECMGTGVEPAVCGRTACTRCVDGSRRGQPCHSPSDCAGAACEPGDVRCAVDTDCNAASECGPALFDFAGRLTGAVGPVEVTNVSAVARDPVPLEGLIPTPDPSTPIDVFVQEEAITEADLNGDGDQTDPVLLVQDRATGTERAIGEDRLDGTGRSRGRAVARVHTGRFSFPAVSVGRDGTLAFLEPETLQGAQDTTNNGQVFENVLRVFGPDGTERTAGRTITADAAPVVNGQSVVVEDGHVYFRTREGDGVPQRTTNLTPTAATFVPAASEFGVSDDGNVIAFTTSVGLESTDRNAGFDVYVLDRTQQSLTRISQDALPFPFTPPPSITPDGRFVAYLSGFQEFTVYDRALGQREATTFPVMVCSSSNDRVLLTPDALEAVLACSAPDNAQGLSPSIGVFDRTHGTLNLLSDRGASGNASAVEPVIAGAGRFIAYVQSDPSIPSVDVLLRDRCVAAGSAIEGCTPSTEILNVATDDTPIGNALSPAISAGGRFVAFVATAGNSRGVYVRDRDLETTELVSTDLSDGFSSAPTLSADGRFVAYGSPTDVLVIDRCVTDDGPVPACITATSTAGRVPTGTLTFSGDGSTVVFTSATRVLAFDRLSEDIDTIVDSVPIAASSTPAAVSTDGHLVAFCSDAMNLEPNAPVGMKLYLLDRRSQDLRRLGTPSPLGGAICPAAMSTDGRFIAFGYVNQSVSVYDRVADVVKAIPGSANSQFALNGDGTLLAVNHGTRIEFYDLVDDTHSDLPLRPNESDPNLFSHGFSISADGRYVEFESSFGDLVDGDTNGASDVFLYDRLAEPHLRRVSVSTDGREGVGSTSAAAVVSADGSTVAFTSSASTLVRGDTNDFYDVFVHDVASGTTSRSTVDPDGRQLSGGRFSPSLSTSGRWVAFDVTSRTTGPDIHVSDLLTGASRRVEAAAGSPILAGAAGALAYSRFTFAPEDPRALDGLSHDVIVVDPDPTVPGGDLTGDLDVADTVLEVLDLQASDDAPRTLGPADQVAIHAGTVAFLRPETAGAPGHPDGVDLDGNGRTDDRVVQLMRAGASAPENLGRPAQAVALSDTFLAALVSERGEHRDLTGDGDQLDTAVAVYDFANATWTDLGQAGDAIEARGSLLVMRTPTATGPVLQVYDTASGQFLIGGGGGAPPGPGAEDFVVGGEAGRELIAFRTNEFATGNDANGDGDLADDVLQVYDREAGVLRNTQHTVRPCRLEACDPRVPYRVGRDTVTFLTFECDEGGTNSVITAGCTNGRGTDLNGNGLATDLVVQTLAVRQAPVPASIRGARGSLRASLPDSGASPAVLGATGVGVCATDGHACVEDAECGLGTCFVPPGGCVTATAIACDPSAPNDPNPCGQDGIDYCEPVLGMLGSGVCFHRLDTRCTSTDECRAVDAAAVCNDEGQHFQRLVNPLAATAGRAVGADGAKVFGGVGRCIEDLQIACDAGGPCRGGSMCRNGTCVREQRVCQNDDDCPGRSTCERKLLTATAADTDHDEIPDAVDVCPTIADPKQEDSDGDGIGDACDPVSVDCGTAATRRSVICRIAALIDATLGEVPAAGPLRVALVDDLELVRTKLDVGGPARRQHQALRKAAHRLSRFAKRLTTRRAKQQVGDRDRLRREALALRRVLRRIGR